MAQRLDPQLYPHAAAYVAALPNGHRAYPECTILADFHCQTLRACDELTTRLPSDLAALLRQHQDPRAMMPVALYMTGQMIALDRTLGGDVQAFRDQVRSRASALYAAPGYRTLFRVLSPNLLLMGVERRFGAFCRGLQLSNVSIGARYHEARLRHPPDLAPPLVLDFFAACFAAALEATGIQEVHVEGRAVAADEARFSGRWR